MENKTVFEAEFESDAPKRVDSITIRWEQCDDPFLSMGCVAVARVSYPIGNGNRRIEKLSSGGLWGIEQGDMEAIEETERDQLSDLQSHLKRFGVGWPIMEEQFSGQG